MIEYNVASEETLKDLIVSVDAMARDGWVPLGGISVVRWAGEFNEYWLYSQAMTRERR